MRATQGLDLFSIQENVSVQAFYLIKGKSPFRSLFFTEKCINGQKLKDLLEI